MTLAQEFVSSKVHIFRENGEIISSSENEYSIIKLNGQTNQFSVDLCVLITNPYKTDSTEGINQQLNLNFKGLFPIEDFDFYDLAGQEGKIFTMTGELTINDIRKSYSKMNFALHRSTFPSSYSRDIHSYFYHISFIMEINPEEFCLDNIIANCAKTIMIEVEDGIINKQNNGIGKIECETPH